MCICRCGAIALLLAALGARADTVADWADKTTEIATDSPNTIRTMALAQSAVYEAVNAITAHFPQDRVDLGPAEGASIDAPAAAPRSRRSRGYREVIAFSASYTAFWARAMVRIVLGPSVAISVVLSAQSATVSARAPSADNKRAIAPQRQMDILINSSLPFFDAAT